MNKLIEEKKERSSILKNYEKLINETTEKIKSLTKSKKLLQEKKDSLLTIDNCPLLFYFYYEKDLNLIDPNDLYINYYYDYKNECIHTTTGCDKKQSAYPNAIDITSYFENLEEDITENTFKRIINFLNKFVENLINEYSPESWEELNEIIKDNLKNNKNEIKSLTKKI